MRWSHPIIWAWIWSLNEEITLHTLWAWICNSGGDIPLHTLWNWVCDSSGEITPPHSMGLDLWLKWGDHFTHPVKNELGSVPLSPNRRISYGNPAPPLSQTAHLYALQSSRQIPCSPFTTTSVPFWSSKTFKNDCTKKSDMFSCTKSNGIETSPRRWREIGNKPPEARVFFSPKYQQEETAVQRPALYTEGPL